MNIQAINLYRLQKQNLSKHTSKNTASSSIKPTTTSINFQASIEQNRQKEIQLKLKNEIKYFKNFINSKGKVTKNDYDDIIQNHPKTLIECKKICESLKGDICTSPKECANIVLYLKEYYESLYGSNYTLVSIGTSTALIAEVLKNLGINVIFLPISHLQGYKEDVQNTTALPRNLDLSIKYGITQGLKSTENDIVVLDFTASGKSLKTISNLLEKKVGIPLDKIHPHSINEDLRAIKHKQIQEGKRKKESSQESSDITNIIIDMACSSMEEVSNVPHFDCIKSKLKLSSDVEISSYNKTAIKVFKEFDDFSRPNARAYSLCVLDEVNKILNKKNPAQKPD